VLQCAVCCSVVPVKRRFFFGDLYCSLGALKHVAVCCSVLQCVAECFGVLQSDTQCDYRGEEKNFWQIVSFHGCVAVCCSVMQCVAVCCSALQCVALYCSMLQCCAVLCSVVQCCAV